MTELSFLVDLLLNHKLTKATKDAVAARIRDIEVQRAQPSHLAGPPPPPAVGHTAAAQQALAARNAAMAQAMSGKAAAGETAPRKFRGPLT